MLVISSIDANGDYTLEWQPGPPAVVIGAHETVQEGEMYRAIIRTGEIVLPRSWAHHATLIASGAVPLKQHLAHD